MVQKRRAHTLVRTKGNGSSSSLVKQLKRDDEERIGGAQHWFKGEELLEWDQPVEVNMTEKNKIDIVNPNTGNKDEDDSNLENTLHKHMWQKKLVAQSFTSESHPNEGIII